MKKLIIGGLALVFSLSSCKKDEPDTNNPNDPGSNNVLVINEGAFQAGNGSLGVYNLDDSTYAANVFASKNGRPLGDVFQSMAEINDELYLVINNFGRIEVVDSEDFTSTGTISGLNSPRYILPVGNSLAYVSDLYSDSVAVVDLNTKTIDHYINISASSEQMVKVGDKVYITNPYISHITVINTLTEKVSTITTTFNPYAIGLDAGNQLLVLCGGDQFQGISGSVDVIDPSTDQVSRQVVLSGSSYTNQMAFNSTRDSVYLLTGNVYKMATTATTAPASAFIDGSNRSFYGIGYHSDNNQIWLGDAKDYVQQGEVLIYNRSGNLAQSFNCGIDPNGFYFNH